MYSSLVIIRTKQTGGVNITSPPMVRYFVVVKRPSRTAFVVLYSTSQVRRSPAAACGDGLQACEASISLSTLILVGYVLPRRRSLCNPVEDSPG
jgi:hypothetical protein